MFLILKSVVNIGGHELIVVVVFFGQCDFLVVVCLVVLGVVVFVVLGVVVFVVFDVIVFVVFGVVVFFVVVGFGVFGVVVLIVVDVISVEKDGVELVGLMLEGVETYGHPALSGQSQLLSCLFQCRTPVH